MRGARYRQAGAASLLLFLALAGCGSRTPAPTPTPTPAATSAPGRTLTSALSPAPPPGPAPTAGPAALAGWTREFGSPAWDRGNAVAVDGSGNIIVAGATQGALPGQTLGGSWDAYVRKYSPEGDELWTSQFTNSISAGVLAVAVDGTGNIVLVGHVEGPLAGRTAAGLDDAFVRKLSPAGTELWTTQFGSPSEDWAFAVATDGSGNIIVAGYTYGALPGQTNAGADDAFVRKLSPAGDALWTIQFGSRASDKASGVAVDRSGNIIVAGYTYGALPGQTQAGDWDAFVRKLSPAGTELWTRQFGSSAADPALGVAVDGSGNIIVAGHTTGALPGQTLVGYGDAFVRKFSPEGTETWTVQFGCPASAEVLGMAVDGSGNIIVAGCTDGAIPGQTQAGDWDAFVRKLSPEGTELWTYQFGSPRVDWALAVAADGSGNIIVAGEAYGALPGQTYSGTGDAFVVRLNKP